MGGGGIGRNLKKLILIIKLTGFCDAIMERARLNPSSLRRGVGAIHFGGGGHPKDDSVPSAGSRELHGRSYALHNRHWILVTTHLLTPF